MPPYYAANSSFHEATSLSVPTARSYAYCGVNDCQDPNVTTSNIDQYVPQDPIVIYLAIGCFILVMIFGTLVHVFLMDEIPLKILNSKPNEAENNNEAKEEEVHLKAACEYEITEISLEHNKNKRRSIKQVKLVLRLKGKIMTNAI